MSCPDPICRLVQCVVTDDIPSYLGDYSLQTGSQFVNLEMSIPAGGGFYIVPPGTIVINVPPNPQFISYQGCKSMVNETVPPGATPAQILQIVSDVMNQVGAQLSLCNAPPSIGNPFVEGSFTNGPLTVGCGGGMLANLIGTLPAGVTFNINGLTIEGGLFSSSISQEDADNQASLLLDLLLESDVQCGWWNAEQSFTCPDMSVKTVAADTIFSTVSQADADAQALAQAQGMCTTGCQPAIDGVSWNIDTSGGSDIPGSITAVKGSITLSYASVTPSLGQTKHILQGLITNNSGSTCTYSIATNITITVTPPGTCTVDGGIPLGSFTGKQDFSAATFVKDWHGLLPPSPNCQIVTESGPSFPTSFTLLNGQSYNFSFQVLLQGSSQAGSGIAMSGTIDITTP